MPAFSERSLNNLAGVHPDLQTIFHKVIEDFDCTIIEGLRTQERQQELYARGRWEPGEIVTHLDGVKRRSRHQDGMAVDAVPWPLDWEDEERFQKLGWFVLNTATDLKLAGKIDHEITWGGLWRWKDYPHFELL